MATPAAISWHHKPLQVKWGGGAQLVFVKLRLDTTAADYSETISITHVGSISITDTKKKFGDVFTGSTPVHDGAITSAMLAHLYAWSYTPQEVDTPPPGSTSVASKIIENMVVINWGLIKSKLGDTAVNFVVAANASIQPHEFPFPVTYTIWSGPDTIEDPTASIVTLVSADGTSVTGHYKTLVSPITSFDTLSEAMDYIQAHTSDGYIVSYPEVDPIIIKDDFSFDVTLDSYTKVKFASVTSEPPNGFYSIDVPGAVFGYSDGNGSNNNTSGHGEDFADWTITVHINGDLQAGTMVLDPEDGGGGG